MQADLMSIVNNFNGTYIIVAVLAVTGVLLTIYVVMLSATIVIDIIRGDYQKGRTRFFGGYNLPQPSQDEIFTRRYQREKHHSDYKEWKKSKGY